MNKLAQDITDFCESKFSPLGVKVGEKHIKYACRWKTGDGTILVNETRQPNVWIKASDFYKVSKDISPSVVVTSHMPSNDKVGFISSAASTNGFKNLELMKLRCENSHTVGMLLKTLSSKLS